MGLLVADYGGVVLNLIDLGQTYHFLGDGARAKACQDEAIQLSLADGNEQFLSSAQLYRGYANLGLDALDLASADFRSAVEHARPWKNHDVTMAVAGSGEVAWQRGQTALSAKLSGFANTQATEIDMHGHTWKREYQRQIAAARERLSDPAFAAAWTEGQKLTLDEAKVLAP